jgi:hypothetical protein
MPKDPTESLSKYLISIFHQLAPNYYPALKTPYYHTKPPISESRMILSVLGYFFPFQFRLNTILVGDFG